MVSTAAAVVYHDQRRGQPLRWSLRADDAEPARLRSADGQRHGRGLSAPRPETEVPGEPPMSTRSRSTAVASACRGGPPCDGRQS
jgi:hypothetical protein